MFQRYTIAYQITTIRCLNSAFATSLLIPTSITVLTHVKTSPLISHEVTLEVKEITPARDVRCILSQNIVERGRNILGRDYARGTVFDDDFLLMLYASDFIFFLFKCSSCST
ncbi:hypothetical protein CDAR_259381 [Caerostris darwini]|uniref:Uncharacterized protein n=1 Tax=Caerostris darwini TaxID=1538125 RepID=A0AAV4VMP7_9ARAC|nr:hypothetical protein CDAR_259381 [Caerostris darwini]